MTHLPTNQLRDRGKNARQRLDDVLHAKYSQAICRRFLSSGLFYRSKTIACYLPFASEVDTCTIFDHAWRARKPVFVPVIGDGSEMRFVQIKRNTRLELNTFGIWEPVSGSEISAKKLDVVATPLAAFDGNCNRIGMGGGYFDHPPEFSTRNIRWPAQRASELIFWIPPKF